jgi:hypothetical protein
MPTPASRATFVDAQKLIEALRDLHDRQHALAERLRHARTVDELESLHAQLDSLQGVSAELSLHYAEAIDRYVAQVKQTLSDGTPAALV